jgi:hypothetical protein
MNDVLAQQHRITTKRTKHGTWLTASPILLNRVLQGDEIELIDQLGRTYTLKLQKGEAHAEPND